MRARAHSSRKRTVFWFGPFFFSLFLRYLYRLPPPPSIQRVRVTRTRPRLLCWSCVCVRAVQIVSSAPYPTSSCCPVCVPVVKSFARAPACARACVCVYVCVCVRACAPCVITTDRQTHFVLFVFDARDASDLVRRHRRRLNSIAFFLIFFTFFLHFFFKYLAHARSRTRADCLSNIIHRFLFFRKNNNNNNNNNDNNNNKTDNSKDHTAFGPACRNMSYRSLAADRVYKATTDDLQPERKNSVGTVFKKAFGTLSSSPRRRLSEPLMSGVPVIGTGNINTPLRKMPTSAISEEASLLSGMRSETLEEVELTGVRPSLPAVRTFTRGNTGVEEVYVDTDNGPVCVAVQGDRSRPPILTYHDLGLNYVTSFQTFFNYSEMRTLMSNFCVYHVNAPGQEEGAAPLSDDYIFPSTDELANQLDHVLRYFGLQSIVGLGVGAGGNILARFAYRQPTKVEALCLINVVSTPAGWIEYGYQKLNSRYLKSKGMTQGVMDYLMWHHFGKGTEERNHDLARVYREYFEHSVHPGNLAAFIDSYVRRTDLGISRSTPTSESCPAGRRLSMATTLQMPIINVCGALSPHQEDTVTLNSRLDPTKSSWMKVSDCSMVLEEVPQKMCEALRLFLQGLGYAVRLGRPPLTVSRSAEVISKSIRQSTSKDSVRSSPWPFRIIENPLTA